jgi:hypothetical protein
MPYRGKEKHIGCKDIYQWHYDKNEYDIESAIAFWCVMIVFIIVYLMLG